MKISNDLEVYTIDRPTKDKLEEICDLRQPVIFDYHNQELLDKCNLSNLEEQYGAFDIKLRNIKEDNDDTKQKYLPFLFKEAVELFQNGKNKNYITEKNKDFLKETAAVKVFKYNDSFLRPHFVSNCLYDFCSGSVSCRTPLRYNLNYRNYFYVTSGKINIKLIPPSAAKYLDTIKDYENFEFRSNVNPWDIQKEYQKQFDKVKVLDVTLQTGQIIYIPAHWWYSFEYVELSSICNFQYRTYMNTISISPELIMGLLQKQNIKLDIAQKL
jgi:hypothetical protein|tara:strand:- start:2867 stop:3676 length:810 start_codon:yes stop_codon:yes gene_type:complete